MQAIFIFFFKPFQYLFIYSLLELYYFCNRKQPTCGDQATLLLTPALCQEPPLIPYPPPPHPPVHSTSQPPFATVRGENTCVNHSSWEFPVEDQQFFLTLRATQGEHHSPWSRVGERGSVKNIPKKISPLL